MPFLSQTIMCFYISVTLNNKDKRYTHFNVTFNVSDFEISPYSCLYQGLINHTVVVTLYEIQTYTKHLSKNRITKTTWATLIPYCVR